jgi:hypothetical protein
MKGDFTRDTFDARKQYRQVLMQQGRVLLDAEWNEQAAISAHRVEATAVDIIGTNGGPEDHAAFGITTTTSKKNGFSPKDTLWVTGEGKKSLGSGGLPKKGELLFSSGHYYVDGMLCQVEQPFLFSNQPDHPGAQTLSGPPGEKTTPGAALFYYLVYLDVWQRHITSIEDARLLEPALGGPDTATRAKTIWQVQAERMPDYRQDIPCFTQANDITSKKGKVFPQLTVRTRQSLEVSPCPVPESSGYKGLENQLYRVEIHCQGEADYLKNASDADTATLIGNKLTVSIDSQKYGVGKSIAIFTSSTDATGTVTSVKRTFAKVIGVLNNTFILDHDPGVSGAVFTHVVQATYKWSRENGSIAVGIKSPKDKEKIFELSNFLSANSQNLCSGDLVEILNDELELEGKPGQLTFVAAAVKDGAVELRDSLDTEIFPGGPGTHLKLRKWDGIDSIQEGQWRTLERDIEIYFDSNKSGYRTGDYWQITARAASSNAQSGALDWQADPQGIEHHYAPLGVVRVETGNSVSLVCDCRTLYPTLSAAPRIFYLGGDGQEVMPDLSALEGTAKLAQPLVVGISNRTGPAALQQVRFTVTAGNGNVAQHLSTGARQSSAVVPADSAGVARCDFCLDALNPNQQVSACLLDPAGNPVGPAITFNASLSVAREVAYTYRGGWSELKGEYFTWEKKETYFAEKGPAAPFEKSLQSARTEAEIDYSLGNGWPLAEGTQTECFAVRWTGKIRPQYSGNYVFHTVTDDGVRLWVGDVKGKAIIDQWHDQEATEWISQAVPLEAEQLYDVRMEYYQNGIDAVAKLYWSSPGMPREIIPTAELLTVQEALDRLCQRKRGCCITIGIGGDYSTLQAAFASLCLVQQSQNFCVSMLPGVHHAVNLSLDAENQIMITGSGCGACVIVVEGELACTSGDIVLRDLSLEGHHGSDARIRLMGDAVKVTGCSFKRTVAKPSENSFVSVSQRGKDPAELFWEDNHMFVGWSRPSELVSISPLIPAGGVTSGLVKGMESFLTMDLFENPDAFEATADKVAQQIAELPQNEREAWAERLPQNGNDPSIVLHTRLTPAPARSISGRVQGDTKSLRLVALNRISKTEAAKNFSEILKDPHAAYEQVKQSLVTIAASFAQSGSDFALALSGGLVGGCICNNGIYGEVSLASGRSEIVRREKEMTNISGLNQGLSLVLQGNRISSCHSNSSGPLLQSIVISDNVFTEDNNSFVALAISLNGNHFLGATESSIVADLLGLRGVIFGNQATHDKAKIRIPSNADGNFKEAANLLEIAVA